MQSHDSPFGGFNQHGLRPQISEIRPGGFRRRLVALLIDTIIVNLITFPLSLVFVVGESYFSINNQMGLYWILYAIYYVVHFALSLTYSYYFLTKKGATLGKQLLGLKVVDDQTGTYIGAQQFFMREVIGKLASGLILCIGFLMVPFRRDRKGLHDIIAGTRVIRS